jgi:hypothetical protein
VKIDIGSGTPIFIAARKIGGAEIIQGTSRIKLRPDELVAVARILNDLSNDARAGKRMTDSASRPA